MLSVRDLHVSYRADKVDMPAVRGVTFAVERNEVLAIVGESGCGKTSATLAVMGLLPPSACVDGEIVIAGRSLVGLPEAALAPLRGQRVALVPQDALSALNPAYRAGDQVAEAITIHGRLPQAAARERAVELLYLVGVPDALGTARRYPHELSGGMRQRVVIAMAIANDPDLLIADEPTSALDVTVQAQILDVLRRLKARTGMAMLLVTHDLGVVASIADRVAVMYGGVLVETAGVYRVFSRPAHPYTQGLLGSVPRPDRPRRLAVIPGQPPSGAAVPAGCAFHPRCPVAAGHEPCSTTVPELQAVDGEDQHAACHRLEEAGRAAVILTAAEVERTRPRERRTILQVADLVRHFPVRRPGRRVGGEEVHAVCGVSFDIVEGETLALVGESGSGKTTTARMLLNLLPAAAGSVQFRGEDVLLARGARLRALRRQVQIVFQDPYAALNPRVTIGRTIASPLRAHGMYRQGGRNRVAELLVATGLDPSLADRYPAELSGGQRQRACIARALSVRPELVVLDEPVSALDVSVRAGILNLLEELQDRLGLSYLLIAHDLAVVRHSADRVAVMYLGRIVESGTCDDIFLRPSHPYTQALLSAVPVPDPGCERVRKPLLLIGDPPNPSSPPSGCRFRTRCWRAEDVCAQEQPPLVERGCGHPVACHFPGPLPA